jgi:DNA polymerase-3 subunit beta
MSSRSGLGTPSATACSSAPPFFKEIDMNVDRRLFHEAMKELVHVANGKAARPILSHVLLETSDDKLTVTATDLTTTLHCERPAEGPLSCCLPARMLAALTKPEGRGQAGDVEILLDGDMASVVVEGLSTRLATKPAQEFPEVRGDSVTDWSLLAMWPAAEIRDALAYVLPAASADTARPHLNAVCLGPDRVAATDGHRLHTVRLPTELPEPLLLHREAAETLRRLLDGDVVILARAGDAIRIRTGSWQVETRLVDARFPPIDSVIPARERAIRMRVETGPLRKALDRVSRLTRDGALRVVVNGVLTLRTSDPDLGEAEVVVPVLESTHSGDDVVTGLKLGYLREAIATTQDVVELGLEGPSDALRVDHDLGLAVVMPMRL